MKTLFVGAVLALTASQAFAQSPDPSLATPAGNEVKADLSGYTYVEPGDTSISIRGIKVGGEDTATLSLNEQRHLFFQADARAVIGTTKYTGWCSPFLITPNGSSPNGYALNIGDPSPCTESGDKDWYAEARALAGKDMIGQRWAFSPFSGLGLRHLSNGTTGVAGYRTDDYLYVPIGLTSRTKLASQRALSVTIEGDALLHGWQKTRDSQLGGGDVQATPTAPAFTIDSFSDVSFSQSKGWALRASADYEVTKHWSLEPYYIHWNVSPSPVSHETATFTVNRITAHQQLGAYEPLNTTNEAGVKLGLRF